MERTDANGTTIKQEYNADGQLTRVLYPTGRDVRYEWTCCRLSAMTDEFGTSRFTYDLANRLTSALDAFGHLVTYRYDAAGRRSEMGIPGGGQPRQVGLLQWPAAGPDRRRRGHHPVRLG